MSDLTKTDKPPRLCDCHGEPMKWAKDNRYRAGGFWRCRHRERDRHRERYDQLEGVDYNRLLLAHRRTKALARQRRRSSTGGG